MLGDAGALGSMSAVKVGDVYHLYYEAWGVKGEKWNRSDYETLQIGHAVSLDGVHWIKDPANPVIAKGRDANDWDKGGTWDPFVIHEDGVFKMWYGGGVGKGCEWGYYGPQGYFDAKDGDIRVAIYNGGLDDLAAEERLETWGKL